MIRFGKIFSTFITATAVIIFLLSPVAKADLADDLKAKIDERNKIISQLETEIASYQNQVEKTDATAKNLKTAINTLELTRKKLSAEINVIQNKIANANLSIKGLSYDIESSTVRIDKIARSIEEMLRRTAETDSVSFVETLLNYPNLSNFWNRVEALSELNNNLLLLTKNLKLEKQNLESKKASEESKKKELVTLSGNLADKKKVADYNKAKTSKLLTDTKNQQAEYQKILNEKIALHKSLEQEVLDYESQLKLVIDPSSLPSVGRGVLHWPLSVIKVTQPFGDTDFARSHAQAYNGRGHNGVDFKASVGTKVMSALDGTIRNIGDTDRACPGASYGRWVLIDHPNGLSTLYAHLSVIKVTAGQNVSTGDLIGYSGDTGYATGPHLHFTVYATAGVAVKNLPSKVCKATYTLPVASLNSYLNPLLYL